MIELLVTLALVVIGLWAMLDLHTRLQISETEAYQRTQALMLLDDFANRLATNRGVASAYVTDPGAGVRDGPCALPGPNVELAARDKGQWCMALEGGAGILEGKAVGALLNGNGCVEAITSSGSEEYLITVVWQGAMPIAQPPDRIRCGKNNYDLPAGSACARLPDHCRRYVSTLVHIAELEDS